MEEDKILNEKFSDLRRQAERLLAGKGKIPVLESDEDPLKLIHELQTYQIELELQNDELRRSQQNLMESNIRYTRLYDFAPIGYLTLNSKGMILNANLTFSDMVLNERSFLINQPLSVFISTQDQDVYFQYKRNLSTSALPQKCELRLLRKDKTLLDVRLESRIADDNDNEIEEYRIVIIDISDKKAAEKAKDVYRARLLKAQKMEAIGTLAGGIAHDFNNILYPILGFTELSKQELPKNHPVQEYLEDIIQGAKRARDLVAQILVFSSHKNKKPIAIPPKPLIAETLKFLRSTIPSNVEIQQDLCDNDDCVMGNPIDIHEIIMNLCTNAYHAMEESGGILSVNLHKMDEDFCDDRLPEGKYCCLSISDTGTGIPQENMDRIFEPYFTTKEIGKGSGLGLSIVHGIVKKYNGIITVKSNPEKGTVFDIFLPIVPKSNLEEKVFTEQKAVGGDERILFIDDEKTIVKFGIRFLERIGYKVTGMTSSEDALDLFNSDPTQFDLVITDMAMPKIMGIELARKMLDVRSDIPIIICTGYSDALDNKTISSIGIKGLIEKPIIGDVLAMEIRKVIDLIQSIS